MAAVDITTIGIEYDTSGLEKGTRAQDKTRESANKLGDSVDKTEKSFSSLNKILGIAAGAMAAVGGVMLAKQFTETADAVSLMDARLKMATGSLQDFKQAQKDIYAISQQNNVGIKETTSLYTKLSDPVRRLGGTSKEVAAIVDAFSTSLRVSGANAQETSSAVLQFGQAMGSGVLQGQEFMAIAESSPRTLKAFADGMGMPVGVLKKLGSEGKLTADVLGNSLVKSLDQLKKEAAGLPDTVSGAITRFKNDVILAVGEISNSQGFTVGFAGLIEQARGLIPVIKDEVMGAFIAVNGWIERNKEEIGKVWEVAKGIVGDVWEVAKGAFSVAGFIVEWATQSGLVKTTFETIRFLIAGFQDGVTAIGAGFAYVGSQIFQFVLSPLQKVLETTAKVAGVFDDQMAANLRAVAKEIDDFAKGGENYAKSVADAFGKGDSAVGRLNAELGKSKEATKEVGKAAAAAGGDFKALQSTVTDTGKKTKQLSIEQQAAQSIREQAHKREIAMLNSIDKEMASYAKDQIDRSKEVTKEIIAGINEQAKTYLAFNKSLDDHAQRMSDMNTLAQLEIDTLGMSSVQRNTLIEQKKIELALEKQLKDIRASNMAQGEKDLLEEKAKTQANIYKSTAELRAQQGEWSKFYGEIYNGLSDSLYRGFEAGKGFGKSFLDSIKNLFKTNIIKIGVQAIMGGGIGLSGAASAATGAGNASSGIGGIMSTISGISDFVGSIGAAGGVFGSTGFMASLAGGLQGAGVGSGLTSALGLQIGNTVSSVLGSSVSGAISSGISAASSVLGAIPVWGWAALAGGALLSKFGGGGDRVTGQQSISGMLGTNNISRDVPFTKSGGLLGKSDAGVWNYNLATSAAIASNGRSYTDTASQESDTAMLQKLNSNYAALQEAAKGYASILGLSADAVTAVSDRINFNLGKTKEETDAAMQAAFGQIANDITNRLAPSISAFSKEGEQVSATMARLAGSLVSVNEVLGQNGFTKFAQTLEGGNAAARLAEFTGGIEKLASGAQYFFENFLTDAEKLKPSADLVTATMARLGQSAVDTIPEFKQLVQGLDLTNEAQAKMYAELIAIAPQFKAIADSKAAEELKKLSDATKELEIVSQKAKEIADERKALQDEYNSLTMTSSQLFEIYKNSLDVSNQSLAESIQAIKDKTAAEEAAAAKAASIAAERKTLQDEYNSLTMTAVELMAQYRNGLDASNQALFDQLNVIKAAREKALAEEKAAAEALAAAQKEASDIAAERATLQDEYNRLTMTEIELMSLKRASLKEQNRDVFDLIQAEKARREEVAKAEASLKASESEWAQSMKAAFDSQTGALKSIISEFGSLAKSLQDLSRNLTTGDLSKASPEDRYKLLGAEVAGLIPKVQSGDKKAITEFMGIADEYLKASEDYNALNTQYFKDKDYIKKYIDEAAQYAQSQVDVAQLQLNAMTNSVTAINGVNNSVQQVLQAITGAASGSGASGAEMGLVSGYQANVLRNVENLGGLENLYQGAISGNPDAYRNLKGQMQRWQQMGLDKKALDTILGAGWYDKLKAIPGFANGGVASGLAVVGERGPELVNFKSPSRVYNANDTQSIIGGSNNKETNDLLREQNRLLRQILTQSNSNDKAAGQILKSVDNRLSGMQTNANFEKAGT